jgi:hypothetical protein
MRNVILERIGEDAVNVPYLLVNVTINDVDRRDQTDWHPAALANPIYHDNRIYYGVTVTDAADGFAFRQGTLNYFQHKDVAIVNTVGVKRLGAGNIFFFLGGTCDNLYIKDSRFVGGFSYRMSASNPGWNFNPTLVVYDNVNWNDDPHWYPALTQNYSTIYFRIGANLVPAPTYLAGI